MKTVYLIVTDRSLEPDVIGVFETKELAIAALKERADQDAKRRNAVRITWINPTQYNLLTGGIELGHMYVTTVKIIERTLHVEGV